LLLDGRLLDEGDGACDDELGESILTPPAPFDAPAEGNWEFETWEVPGDGECEGEFGDDPATRPALRCKGRGALVGCGETMLRDHRLGLAVGVDDEAAAVLDTRENVLGNDDGGALSVIGRSNVIAYFTARRVASGSTISEFMVCASVVVNGVSGMKKSRCPGRSRWAGTNFSA